MAVRFQTERLDARHFERTPGGMVRVPATVSKPGVYKYHRADGTVIREYLPPDEVTKADSLATLEDVAVTRGHPSNMVDPSSWGSVAIGHARGARADGGRAAATLVIARADAQAALGTGLVEVSRGVKVRVDNTPGVTPEGEHYDAVQRDIVYNHIALGPSGWGRQGSEVSLRLDSAGDELIEHVDTKEQNMALKYDGKEFKTDAELAAYIDGLKAAPRADAGNPFAKKEEEEEEEKKAKKDAQDALEREKARADAATAELARRDRADLEARARGVLGAEHKFDSAATVKDIRLAVLAKLTPAVKYDGRTDAYIESAFDIALAQAPANPSNRSDALAAGLHGAGPGGVVRTDSETPEKDPRTDMIGKYSELWKQPLSMSQK